MGQAHRARDHHRNTEKTTSDVEIDTIVNGQISGLYAPEALQFSPESVFWPDSWLCSKRRSSPDDWLSGLAVIPQLAYNAVMFYRSLASCMMAFALIGCQFVLGIEEPLSRGPEDPDHPQFGCGQWDALYFEPCDTKVPGEQLFLDGGFYRYDTDLLDFDDFPTKPDHVVEVVTIDGNEFALISTVNFRVAGGSELRVVGTRGLIIASWGDLRVEGLLDGSSGVTGPGPGSRDDCTAAEGIGAVDAGSGGGGGGGYADEGGPGGGGNSGSRAGGGGGGVLEVPVIPRGGCAGGDAGSLSGGVMPAPGGKGGGVIHLSARGDIRISGVVDIGGSGGDGGELAGGGGGGGGAGGYFGLDGQFIDIRDSAIVAVNGGAGGEGGFSVAGERGENGRRDAQPSRGGAGLSPEGGNGGGGGSREVPGGGDGLDGASGAGGGGGGGSAGHIVVRGAELDVSTNAIISPPLRIVSIE